MNKFYVGFIVAVVAVAGVGFALQKTNNFGADIPAVVTASNSSIVASTTSALALSANSGAYKRVFSNTGSNTIYLSEKATTTFTAGTGIAVFAGTRYEETLDFGNLWTGNVNVITVSGTSSLSISQL